MGAISRRFRNGLIVTNVQRMQPRQSQQTLTTLVRNLPGMAYCCRNDRQWTMAFVSEGCVELTGYLPSALVDNAEIAYGQLIREADRARVWDTVQDAVREDRPFQLTYRIRTANGSEKWVEERGRGLRVPDRDELVLEGFITDISARVRAEEKTRWLARFPEENPNPVLRVSKDGTILYANAASSRLLCVWQCRVGEALPAVWKERLSRVLNTHVAEQAEVQCQDQTLILAMTPVPDLAEANLYGMDITQRKRAQEALLTRDRLLTLIGKMAHVGGWEFDPQTLKGTWTEEVALIHDLDPDTETNVEIGLSFYHGEWQERMENAVQEAIKAGKPYDLEVEMISARGARKWVHTIGQPILQGDRVARVIGTFQDITERKQAEETLRELAERLDTLHRIDRAILTEDSSQEIAQVALDVLCQRLSCQHAGVIEFGAEDHEARILAVFSPVATQVPAGKTFSLHTIGDLSVLRDGQVQIVADIGQIGAPSAIIRALHAEGIHSCAIIPLIAEGNLLGTLNIASGRAAAFAPEQISIAREVADQLAISLSQARLREELQLREEHLRHLTHRIVSIQEEERRRLSREMHDEAGQALTALKINLSLMASSVPAEMDVLRNRLEEAVAIADMTLEQIRVLTRLLRPPALDEVGLGAALEGFCQDLSERAQLSVDFAESRLPQLPGDVQIALYRVVQEALTNVLKHADADTVRVTLRQAEDAIILVVEDNGRGFSPREVRSSASGVGLLGMQERLEVHDGTLEISSAPGHGTRLLARVPWEETP